MRAAYWRIAKTDNSTSAQFMHNQGETDKKQKMFGENDGIYKKAFRSSFPQWYKLPYPSVKADEASRSTRGNHGLALQPNNTRALFSRVSEE